MNDNVLAENIKRIIENDGRKQKIIAQNAGYTPQQFSNMVNGRRLIGGLDVLRIAEVLKVTPNELFGIKDEVQKDDTAI